jgi:glycosyltransferase involved in cell wall biosynthesis
MVDDILIESFEGRSPSLRIAIVTETFPPEINGVAMTLGHIVQGLIARGHMVQVVRPRQARESGIVPGNMEEVLARGAALPNYGELRFGLPAKNRLVRLWTDKRPDVVHVVTEGPLGWSAVAAARKMHLAVTSAFHTNFHSYSGHYGLGLLKRPIEGYLRKLHNRTMATMVPTAALAASLERRGYQNLRVVSRGVDVQLFHPAKRSEALRQSWGLAPQDVAVLHVGRIAKEKNVGLVVAGFRAVQQLHPRAKLVFVGDGPARQSVQDACPDAIFAGMRKGEDLAAHYASADVFLFASLTETYGNVVPEALASGLAVVAFAYGAALELVQDGASGVLVTGARDADFVHAVQRLMDPAHTLDSMRLAAAQSVAHVAWDRVYDNFIAVLQQALAVNGHSFTAAAQPFAALSHPHA